MQLDEEKRIIRRAFKERRDLISASQWQDYGEKMSSILFKTSVWKNARRVFCFVSMKNEPDTSRIIDNALSDGKTLCVPAIIGNGLMKAVVISSTDELTEGKMGIREPLINIGRTLLPSKIDLAVVPCISADESGTRIGHGGGYYDRFLTDFSGKSVVLCSESMMSGKNKIPVGGFDRKADFILSEARFIKADK